MRAIETEYNGVRFRSRLEARWALFFDALGLRWEYEAEAFELSDGTRYLPDFFLPEFAGGVYVEIKPAGDAFVKARAFAKECGRPVWLCAGEPDYRVTYLAGGMCGGHPGGEECGWKHGAPCSNEMDTPVLPLADQAEGENRFFSVPGYEGPDGVVGAEFRSCLGSTLLQAIAAARSHRFWNPARG